MKNLFNICLCYLEEEYSADAASHLSDIFYNKQIECLDKKGRTKKKRDDTAPPVLYTKLIYSKKIMTLFRSKGNDKVNPFDYLNQYCKVKMALIIKSQSTSQKMSFPFKSKLRKFTLNHSNHDKH